MKNLALDHVAVVSHDLDADAEFYSRLGFRVETRYADWAMLKDGEGRGLALLAPGGKHPPHLAMRAPSRALLEELARERNSRVMEHRDGSLSIYLKDPSGNPFEVVYYPDQEEREE
ncbi:MAG TPA: VOC family protein [Blastocatellia bacterium]|nr:VOC family protein [Blastocatellia bacterium]